MSQCSQVPKRERKFATSVLLSAPAFFLDILTSLLARFKPCFPAPHISTMLDYHCYFENLPFRLYSYCPSHTWGRTFNPLQSRSRAILETIFSLQNSTITHTLAELPLISKKFQNIFEKSNIHHYSVSLLKDMQLHKIRSNILWWRLKVMSLFASIFPHGPACRIRSMAPIE